MEHAAHWQYSHSRDQHHANGNHGGLPSVKHLHNHHHHHNVGRQYNTSELIHHGPLLKLCSPNLWSKLSFAGYWETRMFYIHEDKTFFNVNRKNKLRGKWSLQNARIVAIPREWRMAAVAE